MASLTASQNLACRERAMSPGSVFDISFRFLPPAEAEQALALEALFASVRSIPGSATDPAVAMAKLGWWQAEIGDAQRRESQHPVVQALQQTAVLEGLDRAVWQAYIAGLAAGIDAASPASTAELRNRLGAWSGFEGLMVLGKQIDDPAEAQIRRVSIASGLLRIAGGLYRPGFNRKCLPLELVARFGLQTGPGETWLDPDVASAIAGELAAAALDSCDTAVEAQVEWPSASGDGSGDRYFAVRQAVEHRWLLRLLGNSRWGRSSGGLKSTLGDVLAAWRVSRRYGKQQGRGATL
jgi:phytoene/squalene synthetase